MSTAKVFIIGLGADGIAGLAPAVRRRLRRAQMLFGGQRLLDAVPVFTGQKVTIDRNLDKTGDLIKANLGLRRIVVLASGDPDFFGIARYLTGKLGKDSVEIVPGVSLMQTAFARIKESWDDAVFASVHGRPIAEIIGVVRSSHKIGLFTDDRHDPGEIARVLREQGIADCQAYVCEDLGSDREQVVAARLYALTGMKFSPLNILVLIRDKGTAPQPLLGIPEGEFRRREPGGGLITKLEVRAVSLAKLCLAESSVVWDIGAGSGAVAIEASLLAHRGRVFAIEKNAGDIAIIRENVRRFGRDNIEVVQTLAPDNLEGLPDPAAVFIGGSGGRLAEIVSVACRRLRPMGRIVANAATLESLQAAIAGLRANGFSVETALVNISRSKEVLDLTRLEALNPVFIVTGWRASARRPRE